MLAFLSALLLLPSTQAPIATVVDKAHSEINFVAEARFLSAHGFFNTWDAEVQLDRENMTASTIKITIDTKSITTRNDRRDNHLRSNDFFAVDSFPSIVFVSKKITADGDKSWKITGDLTVRGKTREVTVPVKEVFWDNGQAGATGPQAAGRGRWKGAFSIKRKEYNINYDSRMNPIADDIEIQFNFSLTEKK